MKKFKRLIIFYGPPCAGKSTLSRILTAQLNAQRISIDNVRNKNFSHMICFSQKTNKKIFKKFIDEIKKLLANEDLVICEALFISDERKRKIIDLPVNYFNIIYVTAKEEILQKRLIERKKRSNLGSHELVNLIEKEDLNKFFKLSNMPKMQEIVVDTSSSDVEDAIKEINYIISSVSFNKRNLLNYF